MANPKIPKGYSGTYAKNSSGGDTLIMVTKTVTAKSEKGANAMADNKKGGKPAGGGNGNFTPTFRKYADMTTPCRNPRVTVIRLTAGTNRPA